LMRNLCPSPVNTTEKIFDNYRPPCVLGNRKVTRCRDIKSDSNESETKPQEMKLKETHKNKSDMLNSHDEVPPLSLFSSPYLPVLSVGLLAVAIPAVVFYLRNRS